jgi:hypothetical protein
MSRCTAAAVEWKNRRAYRLANGTVELTVLTGGGHIADFRLRGSPINALWEASWPTIEPQSFSSRDHSTTYGDGAIGKFLCGYTGHALALGYFGMPSPTEEQQGLPLHGEAASAEWKAVSMVADDHSGTIAMEVSLPVYRLHIRREISLAFDALIACIKEVVTNRGAQETEFQWVEHAGFGEPLFTPGEASLFVSGKRGVTWPAGYEGRELLANNTEYRWPYAQSIEGKPVDLSQPFLRDRTGFVAALLAGSARDDGFVAVHNRKHQLVAGYCFDSGIFPWVALWEENRAREHAPWKGRARVRGVEFGTSPMPLGLDHAQRMRTLFDVPVLTSLGGGSSTETRYELFLHRTPARWKQIENVSRCEGALVVRGDGDEEIRLVRDSCARTP